MLLSVVIPVYNVEQTLDKCVQSIACCQIQDMEILLVDDGSTDSSPDLCDCWQQRDSRINSFHKDNGGLSDARNYGIERATGQYITFVDSDDYLSPSTLDELMETAIRHPDYDIIEYGAVINEGSQWERRLTFDDHTYTDIRDYWLSTRAYEHTYAWNKIYRRKLFEQVRYPIGRVFEDAYTQPSLLRAASKVATSRKGLYHYCLNPHGITQTADGHALGMLLQAHLQSRMPMDDNYYLHLLNIQIDVSCLTGTAPLLFHRHLNSAAFRGKQKIKVIILNIFGINALCKISKILHSIVAPSRS